MQSFNMQSVNTRNEALAMDIADPLAGKRACFALAEDIVYLVGHSLGPPNKRALERLKSCAEIEWARGLVGSWNSAGWFDLARNVGARLAPLIGADANEVMITDTVSINLFKLAAAALPMAGGARQISVDEAEFPTDQYIADGLADLIDIPCRRVAPGQDMDAIHAGGVYIKSAVNYRSGRVVDMARFEQAARKSGAVIIWDLSHATGAVDLDMKAASARLASGCTYKYLNGGPGAPAFVYASRDIADQLISPLPGWMGHARPFAFEPKYDPVGGSARFASGTPPILSLAALDGALSSFDGIVGQQLKNKTASLGELCIARAKANGLTVSSPLDSDQRGGHVSIQIENGDAIKQALYARGFHTDFRTPDTIRFGLSPLYVRYVDVWDVMEALSNIIKSRAWDRPEFQAKSQVT